MDKKLQKLYTTSYNLLMGQDLWQAHYQILLKEFTELNVNANMMIKNVKLAQKKFKDGESSIEYTSAIENLV